MWNSRTKQDLIIEVWEKLDCENVGASEITAIEEAVRGQFGDAAVDSPMTIARLLADEGAELRHSEIMRLWIERNRETEYDAIFRNILRLETFDQAAATIRELENVRRKFAGDNDKKGLILAKETALQGKKKMLEATARRPEKGEITAEIANWLTIWLQTPESAENWIALRRRSAEFKEKFG